MADEIELTEDQYRRVEQLMPRLILLYPKDPQGTPEIPEADMRDFLGNPEKFLELRDADFARQVAEAEKLNQPQSVISKGVAAVAKPILKTAANLGVPGAGSVVEAGEALNDPETRKSAIQTTDKIGKGVLEAAAATTGGGLAAKGLVKGVGVLADVPALLKSKRVAEFTGSLLGGASAAAATNTAINGADNLDTVEQETLTTKFIDNLKSDLLFAGAGKAISKTLKFIGGIGSRALQSFNDHLDGDRILAEAISTNPADFVTQVNGKNFMDAVRDVYPRVIAKAKPDERGLFFRSIERRLQTNKQATARLIDTTLDKVEKEAAQRGLETRASLGEILGPIEDRFATLNIGEETKALRNVFKGEVDAFAKQVLTEKEYFKFREGVKFLEKYKKKDTIVALTKGDIDNASASIRFSNLSTKAKQKALNTLDEVEDIRHKLYNEPLLDLKTRLEFKRKYAKNADFNSDLLKDPVKENRAQAFGYFEKSVRDSLEKDVSTILPDEYVKYKNLNHYYSSLKDVQPNVAKIAAGEAGALAPTLREQAKHLVTVSPSGVNVRGFISAGQDLFRRSEQIVSAKDLLENPRAFQQLLYSQGAKVLRTYARDPKTFFTPANVQAIRSLYDNMNRSNIVLDEESNVAFQNVKSAIESGLDATPEEQEGIMTQLLQDPGTAQMFEKAPELDYSPHLQGVKSIINGTIKDPVEQELVRQRIVNAKDMSPVKKAIILNELNASGSVAGFRKEPTAQPVERRPQQSKDIKQIASQISKSKTPTKDIIQSNSLDKVIEYAR